MFPVVLIVRQYRLSSLKVVTRARRSLLLIIMMSSEQVALFNGISGSKIIVLNLLPLDWFVGSSFMFLGSR